MKLSRQRTFVAAVALAWVALAPATASPLVLSAFALAHGHEHALTLMQDAGHVDLVLTHAADAGQGGALAPAREAPGASSSAGDHVVHLAGDPASREPARRAAPSGPLLTAAAPFSPAPILVRGTYARARSFARAAAPERTVALRL